MEAYKKLFGHYPEPVQTDDIYMTRANKAYLKERGIRHTGRPLGRKPGKEKSAGTKKKNSRKRKTDEIKLKASPDKAKPVII